MSETDTETTIQTPKASRLSRPSGKKVKRVLGSAIYGDFVSSRYLRRHVLGIGVFVWLCISMIVLRYDCVTSMETVNRLTDTLNFVRTAKQAERSRYMTATREIEITRKIDSLQMGLSVQKCPPYRISYDR